MFYDLHTHSIYSDGSRTPAEIVAEAAGRDLTVALTDHNSVSGLPEFLAAARKMGVEAVPGIEFSTDYGDKELHIVALFVPEAAYDPIRAYVAAGDRRKDESNRTLIQRLCEAGYELNYEKIVAKTPDGRVNRAIIGEEMVRMGYVASVKEAFASVLDERHGYYVRPARPDALETIGFIREIGAVGVLAHPYLSLRQSALEVFLPLAKARGLVAMETRYSTYDENTTALAVATAKKYGLLQSGGSDFHGDAKPHIALGQAGIHRDAYEALKNAINVR